MSTRFKVVIPARYGSTRLAGKPLLDIGGHPMITRVYQQARQSAAESVVIATDDSRIADVVRRMGATCVLTSPDHPSGTDRLQEVVTKMRWHDDDIIVNVQGDEPLIPPAVINQVAANLAANPTAAIATLAEPLADVQQLANPNVVKVVRDLQNMALYFSRAPMPWARDAFAQGMQQLPKPDMYLRHVGLYAYRARFLHQYVKWQPAPLEQLEALEQLRALYYGAKIHVDLAALTIPAGVDTEADLERVRALFKPVTRVATPEPAPSVATASSATSSKETKDKVRILFVCTGNICRSPTAEGVFRAKVEKAGWTDLFHIDSAGTAAFHVGEPPDRQAQKAAKTRGYDISRLRARFISPKDFQNFDYVLVMDSYNMKEMERVRQFSKGATAKLQYFLDFHPQRKGQEVPDPYGEGEDRFELVLDLVEEAADNLLKTMLQDKGLLNCGC